MYNMRQSAVQTPAVVRVNTVAGLHDIKTESNEYIVQPALTQLCTILNKKTA
jgi:hypothetical protein